MMGGNFDLSIIIPTYNEVENIPEIIKRLKKELTGISYEVIFVDDDSPDLTWKFIQDLNEKNIKVLRRIGTRGLASAVIEGFSIGQGRYFVVMDADLQHDPSIIPTMAKKAEEGNKIVIASRYTEGLNSEKWPIHRKIISFIATKLTKFFTKVTTTDPMSGFFLIDAKLAKNISSRLHPIGYKVLLDIIIHSKNEKTIDVPYKFRERYKGTSKLDAGTILDFLDYLLIVTFGRFLSVKFIKYMIVGATGVLVNFFSFWFLFDFVKMDFGLSLIFAIEIAISSNYLFNEIWTFRINSKNNNPNFGGWLKYNIVCLSGSFINYAISSLNYLTSNKWIPSVLIGTIIAALWNDVFSKNYVWR